MEARSNQPHPSGEAAAAADPGRATAGLSRSAMLMGGALSLGRAMVLAGWLEDRGGSEGPARASHGHDPVFDRAAPGSRAASVGTPVRQGILVAVLAAVLAVAPVSAQARAPLASGRGVASDDSHHRRVATLGWPRPMSGVMPPPGSANDRLRRQSAAAPRPIDGAFDARGVIRLGPAAAFVSDKPGRTYEVTLYRTQAGDSAWSVGRRFGVSTMTIWWANRMVAWERLRVGQLLRILPVSGIEHMVGDGDTLDSIARDYHADAGAIAAYNGLEGGVVLLGQRIIVPDGRGGRYVALDDIHRSSPIPRLKPGQADRAPVDHAAVATPLLAPAPSSPTGVKSTGGVDWPVDPDWTAGPVGPASEPDVTLPPNVPLPPDVTLQLEAPLTPSGSAPEGLPTPNGPNDGFDGYDGFERLGYVGERPHEAPDQPRPPDVTLPPEAPLTPSGSAPEGLPTPTGPNDGFDGYDGFERLGFVGERPGAAPDQPAGEAPRGRPDRPRRDGDGSDIVIPADAPVPQGHGARDLDWPGGGPPPGPKQGYILTIDDDRLTLTEAAVRQERSLLWPVYGGGRLTQDYHDAHAGIDIADLRGTPLLAAQAGRVVFAGWRDARAGRTIYLKHGPALFTGYLHMWRVAVATGDWVERGQVIGYMGSTGYSTGSHVHFSVTAGPLPNYQPHTRDPLLYLRRP
ncbi:hypothetical protein BH24CHL8_BH24CHL8_08920 [soil metagenome]